jgi:hypothetical protein
MIPHRKLLLLGLLSLADLCLTWWLLRQSGGHVYESNPLAAHCLERHGWAGLALFKAATVFLGGGLLVVVCGYRPHTGGRALTLACAAVAAVVVYSCWLAATLDPSRPGPRPTVPSRVAHPVDPRNRATPAVSRLPLPPQPFSEF